MKFRVANILSGQETEGRVSIFTETTTPGFGPPLHSHPAQMEVFHIFRGQHKFRLGEREIIAGPGECVFIPAGTAHTFKNVDDQEGLIHFELLPSGSAEPFFDRLVSAFDQIEDMGAFFREHGLELLGPPLE